MNQNTQQAIAQAQAKGFVGIAELTQVTEEYRGLIGRVAESKGISPSDFRCAVSAHIYTANELREWIELEGRDE
jgi:hypothetical protein